MYRLDPGNPPKSCPDCKITGESFKVGFLFVKNTKQK